VTPQPWRNWSGRLAANPVRVEHPGDVDAVATAVKTAASAGLRVKAAGSGHSFSEIGVPDGVLLQLDQLTGILHSDADTGLVTVAAGTPLYELTPALAELGLAMENLGDIDRQTISGATSTGTHGTGVGLGSISTQIRALEIVLADGSIVTCSATERPELFAAARVGLGALGIVTSITLQCVPAFALHVVEDSMPLADALDRLDELVDGNDHFEFFWFPHSKTALTRRCTRLPGTTELRQIGGVRRRLDEFSANTVFEGLLRAGTRRPALVPSITRLASRLMGDSDFVDLSHQAFASRRDVRFNEGEFAFDRANAVEVLREIETFSDRTDEKISFPLEVRFVAADDITLAPTSGRTSCYIAFHQYHRMPYESYFASLEAIFAEVGGRPHWGKMHTLDAATLRTRYPRFDEFVGLRDELDPHGVFTNTYLNRVLGEPGSSIHK
jgi:L-gulono-1,4-lactone dehydrogenase